MSQLAIPICPLPSYAAEDYVISESNRLAYAQLMAWPSWPDYGMVLYGPAASGKSHLASIWAHLADAKALAPNALHEIDHTLISLPRAVLLDGIDALTEEEQKGLFHLLNHIKLNGKQIMLVSEAAPKQLSLTLPDLRSRLNALPTIALDAPDDALLQAIWFKLFTDRQLQVAPAVIDYLMKHCERSFHSIHAMVAFFDRAALEQQRPITIPFVKSLLPESPQSR